MDQEAVAAAATVHPHHPLLLLPKSGRIVRARRGQVAALAVPATRHHPGLHLSGQGRQPRAAGGEVARWRASSTGSSAATRRSDAWCGPYSAAHEEQPRHHLAAVAVNVAGASPAPQPAIVAGTPSWTLVPEPARPLWLRRRSRQHRVGSKEERITGW